MSDNEIRVVITGVASDLRRALDGAKGDLGGLTAAIKAVPNTVKVDVQAQTATATARLRELRDLAKDVPNRIDIQANADTGVAAAKLRLLERQARDTEEAIARAQLGSLISSGAGGGGGAGNSARSLLGGLPAGPIGLGVAAAPLAAAGVGSVTAVAGSAGAAALGLGALATSVLGVGGVGLGSMLGVLVQAKAGITAVSTALDNLDAAQVKYGAHSTQAATAQKDLTAAIADAGPQASQIARQLSALGDQWTQVSGPATKALDQIIVPGLKLVSELMPTVAGIAKQSFDAIGKALEPVFKGLSSPEFKRVLIDLGDAFAKLAAPMTDAFSNLMRAFFNVAVAAAPYLIQIAKAFDDWTKSFAASLAPGQHLNDLIAGLVGQLHSWWNLATALGRLMVTVFSAGAGTGQQLVVQLTGIVNKWNAWLNTGSGQQAMRKFFTDSAGLLRAVLSTLAPIVQLISTMAVGLIPSMTLLLAPLARILASIAGWINGLSKDLPPVLNALPGLAVAVGVLASWQALKTLVASTVSSITGKAAGGLGAAGAAPSLVGGVGTGEKAGGLGIGAKVLGGLGLATFGSLLSAEIGDAIKGGAGRAIKDIGTGASIGGGLGSVFGPWGTAVGAALGAGIGGAIHLFTSQGPSDGDKWATGFVRDLPGHVSNAVAKGLKDAANASVPVPPGGPRAPGQPPGPFAGTPGGLGAGHGAAPGEVPGVGGVQARQLAVYAQQVAAFVKFYAAEGTKAGNAFVDGIQHVKFPTQLLLTNDMVKALDNVPKSVRAQGDQAVRAWQDSAAKQMLAYASSLAAHGKLPKDTVNAMIGTIESLFPGLTAFLDRSGLSSAQAIASHLKLTDALTNLKGAVGTMRAQWGDMAISANLTNSNINQNTAQAMSDLRLLMRSKNQQIRTEAKAEYDRLRSDTNQTFQDMLAQTDASMTHMSALIQAGSATAARTAGANFATLSKAVHDGMASGVLSTGEGTKLIGQALNAELKAFGQAPIPLAGLSAASLGAWQNWWQGGSASQQSGGIGHRAGGGFIGAPGQRGADTVPIMVGAGEAILNHHQQGPVDFALQSTFGVGLGDLFESVTRPHYMAGGGFAGRRRFAQGGVASYGQLEGLWDAAGGPRNVAAVAAAIAEAESGGRSVMQQGQPFATTGWGYWQITPGGPQFLDPMTNARAAVAKYHGAGNTFSPWTTFNDGAYRAFMHGGVPALGGAVAASLQAPHVTGKGTVPTLVRGALGKATSAANAKLSSLAAAGAGGGGGGLPGAQGPRGLGTFDGLQVADWIIPILNWARAHGWGGRITSGYRPGGASEHAGTQWPGGAVDVGFNTAIGAGTALESVLKRYPGHPNLLWGGQYISGYTDPRGVTAPGGHDYGHFSGTGHARGGFAGGRRGFASGGRASRLRVGSPAAMRNLSTVARLVTRRLQSATDLQNQYSGLSGSFSITEAAPRYLNPDGSMNAAGTARHIADDNLLIGLDHRMLSIYERVEPELAEALHHVLGSVTSDQHQITSDQHQVSANKKRIAKLRADAHGLKGPARHRVMLQIAALTKKNAGLASGITGIRSLLSGAGGAGSENQALSTLENAASSFGTVLWGKGGRFSGIDQKNQGVIFTTKLDLQSLGQDIAKTTATASAAPDLSALNQLLSTQLQTAQQALTVSEAQFQVFSGMAPALVGSYQSGIGFVPKTGPALLHRGEIVLPDPGGPMGNRAAATVHTAQGPVELVLVFANNEAPLVKLVDARMNQQALRITSDHSGQRARLMAGVRRS